MTFGERLRELRTQAGLAQRQLARRAKLGTSTIARLAQTASAPKSATITALAQAIGVKADQLDKVMKA